MPTNKTVWTTENRGASEYPCHLRQCLFGGKGCRGNGVLIEAGEFINGGSGAAFGGAKLWPGLRLEMHFPKGEGALRDQLIKELQTLLDAFISEHGLN